MSWHAAHGRPDPYRKTVTVGEVIGCWEVLREAATDPHYGVRVEVRCVHCGKREHKVLAQLRYAVKLAAERGRPLGHRSCGPSRQAKETRR